MSSDLEVADTNGGPPAPAPATGPPAVPVPALTGPLALMDPEARLNQLTRIARTLAPVFNQQGMFEEFRSSGGATRRHINVEGWTLLGLLLDIYAHVDPAEPRPWMVDEDTWAVKIELRHISGLVVGGAVGVCGRTETDRWGRQPKRDQTDHQLQSMAHTRGVSKAFRVPFGVLAKLAGFHSTPAEEMDGIGEDPEQARRAQDQSAGRGRPGGRNGGGESRARARQQPDAREGQDREGRAVPEPGPQPQQPARLVWAPGRAPGWDNQDEADRAHADLTILAGRLPGGHELALSFLREKGWLGRKGRGLSRLTPARYQALHGKLSAAKRRASAEPADEPQGEPENGPEPEGESVAAEAGLGKPEPAGPGKAGVAGAAGWDPWSDDPNDAPPPEPARHPGVDDPAVRETLTGLGWADSDDVLNAALGRHEQVEDSVNGLGDQEREIVTIAARGDDLFSPAVLDSLEAIVAGLPQLSDDDTVAVHGFARNADARDPALPRQIASMIAAHLTDQHAKETGGETGETDGGETGGGGSGNPFDELPF